MTPLFIRLVLISLYLFIQTLWTITNRGKNIENFKHTLRHFWSLPIVLFETFCLLQLLVPWQTSIPLGLLNRPIELFGLFLAIAGTFLASWAKIVMGKNWGKSAQHDTKVQTSLVTSGPFALSRNPIYVGLFFIFLGQQLALRSYFILLTIPYFIVLQKIIAKEEVLLHKYFGKKYEGYKHRVPRLL